MVKISASSIFKLPDLNYRWKCFEKNRLKKRWMYQTEMFIEKLNQCRIIGKKDYVIKVGYETEKDSKIPLNNKKILMLDIATKTMGAEKHPDNHQYFVLIGEEEKYLMKKAWGKLKLIPIDELPKIDKKISKLIEKIMN
ncbi:hypothetical protein CBF28_10225 [Vagococcus carniphilus]|uniref:Uncharacterized protein n=2 Tax=Vagococcus carniphilus TaxID=218144 RepID=A0A430AYW1_9ENTE|nr:hypothetical protein CBF28_10225 [Vagococcus carniphilus]